VQGKGCRDRRTAEEESTTLLSAEGGKAGEEIGGKKE